jgi:hypothetical protein
MVFCGYVCGQRLEILHGARIPAGATLGNEHTGEACFIIVNIVFFGE